MNKQLGLLVSVCFVINNVYASCQKEFIEYTNLFVGQNKLYLFTEPFDVERTPMVKQQDSFAQIKNVKELNATQKEYEDLKTYTRDSEGIIMGIYKNGGSYERERELIKNIYTIPFSEFLNFNDDENTHASASRR